MSELDRLGREHADRVRASVVGSEPTPILPSSDVSVDDRLTPVIKRGARERLAVGVGLAVLAVSLVVPQILFGKNGPLGGTDISGRTCENRISMMAGLIAGVEGTGFATMEEAAEAERQKIIDSGGHPDGGPVAELVGSGPTFRIPYPVPGHFWGTDIVIQVIGLGPPATGYIVIGLDLCADSVTDAFWRWPLTEVECEFRSISGALANPQASGGHSTALGAAEEFRQAVIATGGHPDGRPVAAVVADVGNRFRIPLELDGFDPDHSDFLITVEGGGGGYLVTHTAFCWDAVTDDFRWPMKAVHLPTYEFDEPSWPAALINGTLESDSGCLWIRDESGNRYLALWPRGSQVEEDGSLMMVSIPIRGDVSGARVVTVGLLASLGGGAMSPEFSAEIVDAPIPEACSGHPGWLVSPPLGSE